MLTLSKYLDLNMKMLLQGGVRIKRVKDSTDRLVKLMRSEEQEFDAMLHAID